MSRIKEHYHEEITAGLYGHTDLSPLEEAAILRQEAESYELEAPQEESLGTPPNTQLQLEL